MQMRAQTDFQTTHGTFSGSMWTHLLGYSVVSVFFLFTGIDWGLPSQARVTTVLGSQNNVEPLIDELLLTRAEHIEWYSFFADFNEPYIEPGNPAHRPYWIALIRHFLTRSEVPDESHVYAHLHQMDPRRLDFNPNDHKYGGLFYYSVAGGLVMGHVLGLVNLPQNIEQCYRDPGKVADLHRAGRVTCALVGLGGAILLFSFLSRYCGLWAAWAAGLLFVFSPTVQTYTHMTKPHIFALTLAIAVLWVAYRVLYSNKENLVPLYIFAGGLSGLAAAAALPAAVTILFLLIAHILRPDPLHRDNIRLLAVAAGFLFLGYLLFTPYLLFSLDEFVANWKLHSSSGHGYTIWHPFKLWQFVLQTFGAVTGSLAACLLLPALQLLFVRQKPLSEESPKGVVFFVLCFGISTLALGGLFGRLRLGLCAVAPLLVLCGVGAQKLSGRLPGRIIVSFVLVLTGGFSLANVVNYIENDHKLQSVARWIEANIPPAGHVAFDAPTVPFNPGPYRIGDIHRISGQTHLPPQPPRYIVWTGVQSRTMKKYPSAYRLIEQFPRIEPLTDSVVPSIYYYGNEEDWYPNRTISIYRLNSTPG